VCHGVGTNREDPLSVSRFLCQAGFNVLTFDFRAHGESTGHKTSFGLYEALDIQAAVRFASETYGKCFHGIGVYAISMGSAAALLSLPQLPNIKALVLDSPFARLSDLVEIQFRGLPSLLRPVVSILVTFYGSLLIGARMDAVAPEDYVQHLRSRPVLIFHGDEDGLTPIAQGKRLFQKITGPKEFVETHGAMHVQSYAVLGKAYEDKVVSFFRQCLTN
jgi:alpha-beta hydrolase superfamily lysophospholipase